MNNGARKEGKERETNKQRKNELVNESNKKEKK